MKVRCHVTVKDIREATEQLKNKNEIRSMVCPVSRSVNRKLHNDYFSRSSSFTITVLKRKDTVNSMFVSLVPSTVTAFVKAFDRNQPVRPTNFTIDIPSMYLKKEN